MNGDGTVDSLRQVVASEVEFKRVMCIAFELTGCPWGAKAMMRVQQILQVGRLSIRPLTFNGLVYTHTHASSNPSWYPPGGGRSI